MTDQWAQTKLNRRGLFAATGVGLAATVAVSGCEDPKVSRQGDGNREGAGPNGIERVDPAGTHQAGITRPKQPQPHLTSLVFDLPGEVQQKQLAQLLSGLGAAILDVTDQPQLGVVPAHDLTVTVGIGPRVVVAIDSKLPGAVELPTYRREYIDAEGRGGDLWLQICGSEPLAVSLAVISLQEQLGDAVQLRWQQRAWRGDSIEVGDGATPTRRAPRNIMGFQDGITLPRSEEEINEGVWMHDPAPLGGATIAVVRRFRFEMEKWRALKVDQQERAVGRELKTSRPLSGGTEIDLGAKTPQGDYLVPTDAHARRAHPLALGVPMMLRRSYSIDDPYPGLLFISFQNTIRAFTATMDSFEVADRMLDFTTTTATGTFLVLPGFSRKQPMGSTLFG